MKLSKLFFFLVAVFSLNACASHKSFKAAPAVAKGDNYHPGKWVESKELVKKDKVNVVVIASWCPYCHKFIDKAKASKNKSNVDFVVMYDNEKTSFIKRRAKSARMSKSQVKHAIEQAEKNQEHVYSPNKIKDIDLPFYFVKRGTFGGLVRAYPTALSCSKDKCEKIEFSDLKL